MVRFGVTALLAAATSVLADPRLPDGPEVIPGAYIFEFEDAQDSSSFLRSVRTYGNVRKTFDSKLFRGVSVQIDDAEDADGTAKLLSESRAVRSMWPVMLHKLPETTIHWMANETTRFDAPQIPKNQTSKPFSPHVMPQVDKLIKEGYTGKGYHVAVIDTGIDYKHPALGGCFGEECLVTRGYDFVGDDYTGRNEPVPDDDPMDCEGHGSHLAGTIAAQENPLGFTGAATGVKLSAYRIFGCYGSATDEVVLAGLTQAFDDGADIVSLSLGSLVGWPDYPWSQVVSRMVDAGVPCIVAAGNSGHLGAFASASPADGKGVTAISAIEADKTPLFMLLGTYEVGGREAQYLYRKTYIENEPATRPLISLSLDKEAVAEGCEPFPEDTPDLTGYTLLLRDGGCDFSVKSGNAVEVNATAIIVYHDSVGTPREPTLPHWFARSVAAVDAATGEEWVDLLKANTTVTVTIPAADKEVSSLVETENTVNGGAVTFFSSWGPTWTMDAKPQFGAPGGSILSTFPLRKGGYAVQSGTSMSTPLVAAIVALLGEVRGTLNPGLLESLLAATSKPQRFNDGNGFEDFLAPVAQQGAGSVQAYDAAFATTLVQPSSLSFNDTDFHPDFVNFTLTNEGKDAVTYKFSNIPSRTVLVLDDDGSGLPALFPNEMVEASAELAFGKDEVTLNPGDSSTVKVSATAPDVEVKRLGLWSGWVAINGTDGSSFVLPYQGLAGSLRSNPIFPKTNAAFVSRGNVPQLQPVPENTSFVCPPQGTPHNKLNEFGAIVPLLIGNYILGTRYVKAEVIPLNSTEPIGQHNMYPSLWQTRGRHIIEWGGLLDNGEYAPAGAYKFRVSALRLRGDEENEDDWDVDETQAFSISYMRGNETVSR